MAATVKVFTFSGLVSAPVVSGTRLSYDSIQLLKFPYLGRQTLSTTDPAVDETDVATAPAGTQIAFIQVQPGKSVAYEVTPEGHDFRPATTDSPVLTGDSTLQFGPGWRLSVLEVTW